MLIVVVVAAGVELPAVEEGQSRDQRLSVSVLRPGTLGLVLSHRPAAEGSRRQQSPGLQDRSVPSGTTAGVRSRTVSIC